MQEHPLKLLTAVYLCVIKVMKITVLSDSKLFFSSNCFAVAFPGNATA